MQNDFKFVDLHYHVAPDLFVRKHSVLSLGEILKECAGAAFIKSHLGSTVDGARMAQELGYPIFGSLTLNKIAGGIHPKILISALSRYAASSSKPLLVYFPTITCQKHKGKLSQNLSHPLLCEHAFEPESVVNEKGKVKPEALEVLKIGKDYPVVFATGHTSYEEVLLLGEAAQKIGIKKLLITHPSHPCLGLTADDLLRLSKESIFWFEQTALTFELGYQDEIDFRRVLSEVPQVIFSSDFGQVNSQDHTQWYLKYRTTFSEWGFSSAKIEALFKVNPLKFLGLDTL